MTVLSYDHLIGFGEAMVRLSTPVGQTLEQAPSLSTHIGGAELNGLIAAAAFGMPSTWVSGVNNDIGGRRIVQHAESHGVAHSIHTTDDARTGLYFVEMASYPRATRVFYDRAGSAASLLDRGMIDWDELINSRSCFYFSGITAGISATARASVEEALDCAAGVGAVVALDINYRSKLWSEEEAYGWVQDVLPDINILSASYADLEALKQPTDDLGAARKALGVDVLVVTSKMQRASSITVAVRALDDRGSYEASGEAFVVDPFGTGDAMIGALLAIAPGAGLDAAVQKALGAALIAYGMHGDALSVDPTTALNGGGILR